MAKADITIKGHMIGSLRERRSLPRPPCLLVFSSSDVKFSYSASTFLDISNVEYGWPIILTPRIFEKGQFNRGCWLARTTKHGKKCCRCREWVACTLWRTRMQLPTLTTTKLGSLVPEEDGLWRKNWGWNWALMGFQSKKFNVMVSRSMIYGKSFYNITVALKKK